MYVMGTQLPKDSPCFRRADDACTASLAATTKDGTKIEALVAQFKRTFPADTLNPFLQPSNPLPPSHDPPKMGRDDLAGGSADDIWQKVQSGGREIYVKTNGYYSGGVLHTYIVANLPESDIVGAPQSVMNDVEGNCTTRHYHVLGSLFFAGKNRSGMAMESTPPEDVERKLVPNSPFEKAFDMLCNIARGQK
jgi:hypothetical protein